MEMIVHQTVGVHLPSGLLTSSTQPLEEARSIQIIPKNLLAPIASAHRVINGSFVLNAQLARHCQLMLQV
jgi:hypothetical protein